MEVTYKQGMTEVWTDGEKIKITNPSNPRHVEENVDRIFGVGEYQKIYESRYMVEERVGRHNTLAREFLLLGAYIPQRAVDDLADQKKGEDLVGKYFKKKDK